MKTYIKPLLGLSIILFLSSCKKEITANKLVGRWQIQQVYNGYAIGGDFKWSTIPNEYKSSIAFNRDGSFTESLPISRSPNRLW